MGKWLKPNTLKKLAKVNLTPMAKRKNQKTNNLVINNNTYELHKIRWLDIVGDSTLGTAEEFDKMTCAEIISIAYIYKKTEKFLYIFSSYQENEVGFGDRNIIPMGCILKIEKKAV